MMTFHFANIHREPIKAESLAHLRDLLKTREFRKGYRAVASYEDGTSFHKVYGKDFDGNVIEGDYIGRLYQGDYE